jgi:hypothetical protein
MSFHGKIACIKIIVLTIIVQHLPGNRGASISIIEIKNLALFSIQGGFEFPHVPKFKTLIFAIGAEVPLIFFGRHASYSAAMSQKISHWLLSQAKSAKVPQFDAGIVGSRDKDIMLFLRQKAHSVDVSFMSRELLCLLLLFEIKQNNVCKVVSLWGSSKQKWSIFIEFDRK